MTRRNRAALVAAAVLLVAVSGTVLATRSPQAPTQPAQLTSSHEPEPQNEAEEGPSADALSHAAERLGTVAATLEELSATYGFGGAVRLVAWSNETGMSVADIAAMRDAGGTDGTPMGWGQIAKDLGVHPGIGSIMGNGGGHGRDNAPGQQKDRDGEDDSGG